MTLGYQVRLKDEDGVVVAIFDDFRRLDYRHRINSPGVCALALNGNDDRTALFELDGQIEIWRRFIGTDPAIDLPWYLEWEGFYRTPSDTTNDDGLRTFTAYGVSYLDLAAREIIAYYAGTAYTEKTGTGSAVMGAFVNENIGPSAGNSDRFWSGVQTGLTVSTPAGGSSWAGKRAHKNLLETLQQIANATGVDFDIVGTGANTYDFRTYIGQRGTDRTTQGLVPSTGKNSAGNDPVVFALEYGNMARPVYSFSRQDEVNTVLVLGRGEGQGRSTVVRINANAINASKRNRRAVSRNASGETTTAGLNAAGDEVLETRQASEELTYDVLQLPALYYGKHYTWGDSITAKYGSHTMHQRILGVRVSVSPSDGGPIENISIETGPVP